MVGAALLWLLASRIDWEEFRRALAGADLRWVALGAAILLSIRLLSAYRWHLLLRDRVELSLGRVVRLTFVADFLTNFLPSGIGTDAARAWVITRTAADRLAGVSSIVMDRILGIWVLLLLGGIAAATAPVPLEHRGMLTALLFGCLLASAVLLPLLFEFRSPARRALERLPGVGTRVASLTDRLLQALEHYRREPRLIARTALLAIGLNGLRVVMVYAFGVALGNPASLHVHAAFVPVIFAVNQIPISIDSIGVRESMYVYLYALAGVPAAISLAVALVLRFTGYILSLPGAILYVLGEAASQGRRADVGGTSVLVDAHVHIHGCFDLGTFLDAAYRNFAVAARAGRLSPSSKGWRADADRDDADFAGVLLLTEGAGEERFSRLAAAVRVGVGHWPAEAGGWTFHATDEAVSVTAVRGPRRLVLVAGRQVATSDGLEVLVFGSLEDFEDGRPLVEVLELVRRRDLLHAIPWGAGKWLFWRGRLLTRVLDSAPRPLLCLGDEGGRPVFWRRVGHFDRARRRGIRVLRGTDPLPFPSEVSRAGSFGFRIDAPLDLARPMATLREALADPAVEVADYGRLERPVAFFAHQWAMQRLKRKRGAGQGAASSASGPVRPGSATASSTANPPAQRPPAVVARTPR